jgi:hypothetical protein
MTPTNLIADIYAVEVPEGMEAFDIECIPEVDLYELTCYEFGEFDTPIKEKTIDLPPGSWQIICPLKEVTEEVAAGIVQVISSGKFSGRPQYRRYDRDLVKDMPARCWTRDSRHALETLVASKGLHPDKTLIIKKVA